MLQEVFSFLVVLCQRQALFKEGASSPLLQVCKSILKGGSCFGGWSPYALFDSGNPPEAAELASGSVPC